jgi:4a-hydroxytetrahydrobiopterin dehydratase
MVELALRDVIPPNVGDDPLKGSALRGLEDELGGGWEVIEEHHLEKLYTFKDLQQALAFSNDVWELAEKVDHHPEICLTWGRAKVTIWTHSIDGLSEADFVLAAKCDQFYG